jgi:hypothetical protein
MFGISSSGKEALSKVVESIFDQIAIKFIGDIPRLKDKKRLIISSEKNYGLSHLFVQAMQNKAPNAIEQDALKSLLESSYGYIESLKNKTMSNVAERMDGLAKEARIQKRKVSAEAVQEILNDEMSKAKSHLVSIIEYESTKYRNIGTMMQISRVSASLGDEDPTVFFVVVRDRSTCKECIRLNLREDGVTPRLWKLSQLKQGYHKRGESVPSAFGNHNFCRCTLTYLSSGFSFNKHGKLMYVKEGHDAYKAQQE